MLYDSVVDRLVPSVWPFLTMLKERCVEYVYLYVYMYIVVMQYQRTVYYTYMCIHVHV